MTDQTPATEAGRGVLASLGLLGYPADGVRSRRGLNMTEALDAILAIEAEALPSIEEVASALYETDPPESWMRTGTDEYRKRATAMLAVIRREREEWAR